MEREDFQGNNLNSSNYSKIHSPVSLIAAVLLLIMAVDFFKYSRRESFLDHMEFHILLWEIKALINFHSHQ